MATLEELKAIVDEANKAYLEARRKKDFLESIQLCESRDLEEFKAVGLGGRVFQIMGWDYYYIGNLAHRKQAIGVIKHAGHYYKAILLWQEGLKIEKDPKIRISILEGLTLAWRWLVDEGETYPKNWFELLPEERKRLRKRAYEYSQQGIVEAGASGDPELLKLAQHARDALLFEEEWPLEEAREKW